MRFGFVRWHLQAPEMGDAASAGAQPAESPSAPAAPSIEDTIRELDGAPQDEQQVAESSPVDEAEAEEQAEEQPEEKPEDKASARTARRMQKLLQERAQAREELATAKRQAAEFQVQVKAALLKLTQENQALKRQLTDEYGEDLESPERRLAAREQDDQLRQKLAAERAKLEEQATREREQAEIQDAQAELESEIADTLEDYPHLTRGQLIGALKAAYQADPQLEVTPDLLQNLAQRVDADLEKRYEQRLLSKHGKKLSATKPVPMQQTVAVPNKRLSTEEMAADIEKILGPDYFR